jgi:hypothetical protein
LIKFAPIFVPETTRKISLPEIILSKNARKTSGKKANLNRRRLHDNNNKQYGGRKELVNFCFELAICFVGDLKLHSRLGRRHGKAGKRRETFFY